ncbi:hypothetical protein PybrP1_008225 [[Pythium] brassicae (nom. inval.)]|nr:hypothetical protein PybrP1_008225 [[Pythium] brassicae (nom. inval.)]
MAGSKRRVVESSSSSSSSDSDDDVPLSKLRADARAGIDITVKSEPPPEPAVKAEPSERVKREANGGAAAPETKVKVKAEAASDSDDDVPISGLRKKVKVEASAPAIKYKQQECTEELYQTLKGRLTQELLCRWWYAIEWPPTKAKETVHKLHGVQELDGFRGAFIRVRGDEMGSIVDTRTPVGKPSFLHLFAMPSAELQNLLVRAYDKQIEALIAHEGENVPMLKDLRAARASAAKIAPEKADRSVQKALKGYKELAEQLREIEERALKEENTATEEEDDDDSSDDDDDDDE